jgi:hypothetical protein
MSLGCGGDLLQEVIVTDAPRPKSTSNDERRQKAYAMGQLSGKFVVTPDWEALFEKA